VRAEAARPSIVARAFAWTGTLLFAASLVYFVYSYLTRYGVVATEGDSGGATAWNTALFAAFALHHSVFAREPVRHWMRRQMTPEVERAVYVWIASLLFLLVCAAWRPVAGLAWQASGTLVWLLRGLQAAGAGLALWSASIVGIRVLAGLAQVEEAARPERASARNEEQVLQTKGPYGWVRHPIYAGWFLMVFSASPMTMTRLVFATVTCAYLLAAIPLEERTMRATSGGAYDRYMARVPWRLLPGLY
jgi:protein-S-isoprenylcysteine O-methyltransferase Ste14